MKRNEHDYRRTVKFHGRLRFQYCTLPYVKWEVVALESENELRNYSIFKTIIMQICS